AVQARLRAGPLRWHAACGAATPQEVSMRIIGTIWRSDSPRWRVAVLDGDPASRVSLRVAVEDAGGAIALEAPLRLDAVALMQQTRPRAHAAHHGGVRLPRGPLYARHRERGGEAGQPRRRDGLHAEAAARGGGRAHPRPGPRAVPRSPS